MTWCIRRVDTKPLDAKYIEQGDFYYRILLLTGLLNFVLYDLYETEKSYYLVGTYPGRTSFIIYQVRKKCLEGDEK